MSTLRRDYITIYELGMRKNISIKSIKAPQKGFKLNGKENTIHNIIQLCGGLMEITHVKPETV